MRLRKGRRRRTRLVLTQQENIRNSRL